MHKAEKLQLIRSTGIIAIMRAASSEQLVNAARAIHAGGIRVIEVTMTTPGALGVIAGAGGQFRDDDVLIGAGSVLDPATARAAILSGAGFIVSPSLNTETISLCLRYSIPVMPGCFTPTEIVTAWEAGADMVKLFPAELGGPALLRALSAPLPQVSFVPVGGVSINNTAEYIRNGAAAVGVGNSLVSQKLLEEGRIEELSDRAAAFVREVERGRHPS